MLWQISVELVLADRRDGQANRRRMRGKRLGDVLGPSVGQGKGIAAVRMELLDKLI